VQEADRQMLIQEHEEDVKQLATGLGGFLSN
jgi:hypothetical protein